MDARSAASVKRYAPDARGVRQRTSAVVPVIVPLSVSGSSMNVPERVLPFCRKDAASPLSARAQIPAHGPPGHRARAGAGGAVSRGSLPPLT